MAEKSELVKIGALWKGEDQNGNPKLTGKLGDARLLVLKNTYKEEGSKQPDYVVYVAKAQKKEEG